MSRTASNEPSKVLGRRRWPRAAAVAVLLLCGMPAAAQDGGGDVIMQPPFEEFWSSGTAAADPVTGTLTASAGAAEGQGPFTSVAAVASSHPVPAGLDAIEYVLDATVLRDAAAAQGSWGVGAYAAAVLWIEVAHDGCAGCTGRAQVALADASTGDDESQMGHEVGEERPVAVALSLRQPGGGTLPAGNARLAVGLTVEAGTDFFPGILCDRGSLCSGEAAAGGSASVAVRRIVGRHVAPAEGLPDVAVTDFRVEPAEPTAGDEVALTATVQNLGEGAASSFDVVFQVDDGQELARRLVEGLEPEASVSVEASWTAVEGDHILRVTADAGSQVAESDESNNEASVTVQVKPAPVRGVELSPDAQSGTVPTQGSIVYEIRLTNLGTGPETIHLTKTPNGGGWRASLNVTNVDLGPGQSATFTLTVKAPNKASSFRVEVTATSQADPGVHDVAVAETTSS